MGAALQVAVRGGRLREREDPVYQHLHSMRFQQGLNVFNEFVCDGAILGDGALAHRVTGHCEGLLHNPCEIHRGFSALLHGDLHQAAARGQHL